MALLRTPPASPSLLVVAEDADVQQCLHTLLADEGYDLTLVSTLEQALTAVARQPFDLILAELYVGPNPAGMAPAHVLRRRAHPTPMGLLMTDTRRLEDIKGAGFAFAVAMPFELDDLLTHIAEALTQKWTAEHQRQAGLVYRFFAAVEAQDWICALALCHDEIRYYPPPTSPVISARALEGKDSFLAYLLYVSRVYPVIRFTDTRLYATPRGFAVRFVCHWVTAEDRRERRVATALFHFAGDRISQIGTRLIPLPTDDRAGASSAG